VRKRHNLDCRAKVLVRKAAGADGENKNMVVFRGGKGIHACEAPAQLVSLQDSRADELSRGLTAGRRRPQADTTVGATHGGANPSIRSFDRSWLIHSSTNPQC
jgi:hypothetical protein